MGCSPSTGEDSNKGSTVSTQSPPSEWKHNLITLLVEVFHQEQTEGWYNELVHQVVTWEDENERRFRKRRRFQTFLILSPDAEELKFSHQSTTESFWGLLQEDLSDVRNPIGAFLLTFSMALTRHHLERVQDIIDKSSPSEASFLLASLTANILKMVYILQQTMIQFYTPISDLLKSRGEDVESLLLNSMLQVDMYIMMQRLANVLMQDKTVMLKNTIHHLPEVIEAPEDHVTALRVFLQKFILTESISEKRGLLEEAEKAMRDYPGDKERLLVRSILVLGMQTINSDLLITKLLTARAPGFLYFIMNSIDSVTNQS